MDRKDCWYSIIRYSPNEISGEIINVGLILHSIRDNNILKFYILDDSSPKVRSLLGNKIDESTYKSYKDIFEYYLNENMSVLGYVGTVNLSSPYQSEFLFELYDFFKNKKMSLSEPTFSLSNDVIGLFNTLFVTYIGKRYFPDSNEKEKNVKGLVRRIFEERKFLNKKVIQDISIKPMPDLPIKLNVDFGFKNGVWNYLQAIPSIKNPSRSTEWFAKTKFLIESLNEEKDESKIYLLYRTSVINEKSETLNLIKYFGKDEKVMGLDLDNQINVTTLCDKIEREAHIISEVG
ncbi:DUF3037 domain-containing protein [Paenibacillus larvae]|uniref:DUF3037 domain-containing protein n=1 Tax=Paenibacillus larvae subsp. larvae TaxID=147375 RepID=A0A2L1U3M0_9BACL|nr:DUF3037 domain-containing protein [Paenibacillus larvae]AQZ45542.1 hypothetical protein B5S25_01960 [Paenibacillus larvae subsp. pulvifaciens]AVF27049.1 hypothetical protein ERICIII_02918 [Paenibacillus larvae subsp. larvae]AVF27529.1 hypothetical protein ERICIII_03419 [Paenibacillus larvae subsp. larvae]MBH0342780.1 hypothetical protein [Paenibacillus larvae]MBH0342789.1 hypothetical protein [Paenibacillus larvae]